ncbi:hypothetical protein NFI96_030746, partial [Prochilodus magdalenae]
YKRHLPTTSNTHTPNSTMVKTKELSEDTRNRIVDLHQAGKTESAIGKQLDVKKFYCGAIIRKWKTYKTTTNLLDLGLHARFSPWGQNESQERLCPKHALVTHTVGLRQVQVGRSALSVMASVLSEEQFTCCICLDLFHRPVSIPCGHNFCLSCIQGFWDTARRSECPLCKEHFPRRPELRINHALADITEGFKRSLKVKPDQANGQGTSQGGRETEERKATSRSRNVCGRHRQPLDIYCKTEQVMVCSKCAEGQHRGHQTVNMERESNRMRVRERGLFAFLLCRFLSAQGPSSRMAGSLTWSAQQPSMLSVLSVEGAVGSTIHGCQVEQLVVSWRLLTSGVVVGWRLLAGTVVAGWRLFTSGVMVGWRLLTSGVVVGWRLLAGTVVVGWRLLTSGVMVGWRLFTSGVMVGWRLITSGVVVGWRLFTSGVVVGWRLFTSGVVVGSRLFTSGVMVGWRLLTSGVVVGWRLLTSGVVVGWRLFTSGVMVGWRLFTSGVVVGWRLLAGTVVAGWRFLTSGVVVGWRLLAGTVVVGWRLLTSGVMVGWRLFTSGVVVGWRLFTSGVVVGWRLFTSGVVVGWRLLAGTNKSPWARLPMLRWPTCNRVNLAELCEVESKMQRMVQDRLEKLDEVKLSAQESRKSMEKELEDGRRIFSDLLRSIQRSQAELEENLKEKQREVERRAASLSEELEKEIAEIVMKKSEVEQFTNSQDPLHLVQNFHSVVTLPRTKDWSQTCITNPHTGTVRRALATLEEMLRKQERNLCEAELRQLQQYAVDISFDPQTAAPWLVFSSDLKQASLGYQPSAVPSPPSPLRFDSCVCVLGQPGITTGRRYWVVQVGDKTDWELGVARESINRKGAIVVRPDQGFWAVCRQKGGNLVACAGPAVPLVSCNERLQKVGVFVDHEEGLVAFYDVEARSHIYSYTGCTFGETLYPYFNPCLHNDGKNTAPLIICPIGGEVPTPGLDRRTGRPPPLIRRQSSQAFISQQTPS